MPAPAFTPPPGWTSVAQTNPNILTELTRHEPDGTDSTIIIEVLKCVCSPENMAAILQAGLKQDTGVTIARSSGTSCGQPASEVEVTGFAQTAPGRKNFLVTILRSNDLLYTQIYTFTSATPKPDAIATAQGLCPNLLASGVSARRFAVVVGKAIHPITQPAFDRWANEAAAAFAREFLVTAVPMPAGFTSADPALCSSLGVVGFLVPSRLWHMSSTTVTMTVRLTIFDCDGDRFFDDSATQQEARNQSQIPQAQADSLAWGATVMLLNKFSKFEAGHQVMWARLLANGSLQDASPSPSPSP